MKTLWTLATLVLALGLSARLLAGEGHFGFEDIDFSTPLDEAADRLAAREDFAREMVPEERLVRLSYRTRLAGQPHRVVLSYRDERLDAIELRPRIQAPAGASAHACQRAARQAQDAVVTMLGQPDRRETRAQSDLLVSRALWSYGSRHVESRGVWRPDTTHCQITTAFLPKPAEG
jgi:hypothetical protein